MKKLKALRGLFGFMLFIVYGLLAVTVIFPVIATVFLCAFAFGRRVELSRKYETLEDYPDLKATFVKFKSKGCMLDGFFVVNKDIKDYKAVIVMAHGIGCSRANYMARYDYFAGKGYIVFAYDCTGTCKSEGRDIKGLPQSQLDLENAINYVGTIDELKGYRILVYGHSWGGYAAATVLNNKKSADKITAVATLSGFNDIWNIVYYQVSKYTTKMILLAKPWLYLHFIVFYGKRALYTGIKGINKYKGDVLVMHSKDDKTVRYLDSVAIHQNECTNPNARFVIFEDRGHTLARPIEIENEIKRLNKENVSTLKRGKSNVFEFNLNSYYEFADRRRLNSVDSGFLDIVENFYSQALAKAEEKTEC